MVISSANAFLDQPFEIAQILVDPTRNGAAEARGQLQGHASAPMRKRRKRNDTRGEMIQSAAIGALTAIDPSAASIASGLVPFFGICLSGVKPRVFMFRKRAPPAVGKIKDRHVKYEHGVMSVRAPSKNLV